MEPFRATRLWNGLIKEFRNGIQPRRHRWRMRYYDNCFSSSEAIAFLLKHLHNNANFGPWVTSDQTIRLLSKFIDSHVIVEVKSSNKGPFVDDGRLYRLCPSSPIRKLRSALNSRTNLRELAEASPKRQSKSPAMKKTQKASSTIPSSALNEINDANLVRRPATRLPSCHVIPRSISKTQVEELWKSAALMRLQRITGVSTIEDFMRINEIQALHIIQNNTHVSRNGIVLVEDKSLDLPHWVLSAMRCLAHWPNKNDESELPSYPGFERDVFKTISNYFHSHPEPLLTYNLYDIITGSFLICDRRDRGIGESSYELTTPPSQATANGLSSFGSVENLMLDMTMGWTPLTKYSGHANEGEKHGGHLRRSLRRQRSNSTQVAHRSSSQPARGSKGNDNLSSGTIFCITSHSTRNSEPSKQHAVTSEKCEESVESRRRRRRPLSAPGGYRCLRPNPNDPATHASPSNEIDDYGFLPMYEQQIPIQQHIYESLNLSCAKRFCSDPNLYGGQSDACSRPAKHSFRIKQPQSSSDENTSPRESGFHHYASEICLTAANRASTPDSQASFNSDMSRNRNTSFRIRRKFSSLTNIDIKSSEEKSEKRQKSNLFISKKFGSASEKIQKFFNKQNEKSELKKPLIDTVSVFHGSLPNLTERPLDSAETTKMQTTPPYPSPLRATVSHSALSSSRNNSGSTLQSSKSAVNSFSRRSVSSSSLKWTTASEDQLSSTTSTKQSASSTSKICLCLSDDQSYTLEGLKMCCLLLPPPNRKKLHLLLKLMAKMVNNTELNLSKHMSTKALVLETFWRSILSCNIEIGLDEILAIKVVTYMMEHYDEIMTVSAELTSDVEERMLYLRRTQVKYSGAGVENVPASYCQKITEEQYKEQKLSHSESAIASLLETIINNKTMAVKVKKKKLKQFQKEYPEIYAKRLPTTTHEAELFPQKPKIKQPMMSMKRSLTKFKTIR